MKIFRAISIMILPVILGLVCGCNKSLNLDDFVTEARTDIFYGENADIKLSCAYGYELNGEKEYFLTFKLGVDPTTEATYSIELTLDKTYTEKFTFNPVSHTLTAKVKTKLIENKFTATVICGSSKTEIDLVSIVPEKTLSIPDALSKLSSTQPSLIDSYLNEYGDFDAKICIRISVKNDKPYYYIAFTRPSNEVKAFLLDGFTAEVLAVRDIF